MVIGLNFTKLWDSEYYQFDEKTDEFILLDGAPLEIVKLFEIAKEIMEEEKRTGKHIF